MKALKAQGVPLTPKSESDILSLTGTMTKLRLERAKRDVLLLKLHFNINNEVLFVCSK